MPTFVDAVTGEQFEADDPDPERAKTYGLIPLSEWEYQQRPLGERTADSAAGFGASVARGVMAPIEVGAGALGADETAAGIKELRESSYGSPEALEQRARDPVLSSIGESALPAVTGLLTGGSGLTLRAALPGLAAESAVAGATREAIAATEEGRDFSGREAAGFAVQDLGFGAGGHSLMRLMHLGPTKIATDAAVGGTARLLDLTRGVAGNKFVQGVAGDVVEDLSGPAFKLGGAAAGFGAAGPVGAFAGYIGGKRLHKLIMTRGVRPAIGLAGDIAAGGRRADIDEHAAGYWLGKRLRQAGDRARPIAERAIEMTAAAAKKYGPDAAGVGLLTAGAFDAYANDDDAAAPLAAMGIGLFSRRLFNATWRGAKAAGTAIAEHAPTVGKAAAEGVAQGAEWLGQQPGVQKALADVPAKIGGKLGAQAAKGLVSSTLHGAIGGAAGSALGPVGAAAGEALGREFGPRIGNAVLTWFRGRAGKTTVENVKAAVEEAALAGAAKPEIAAATKAAVGELNSAASDALKALAKETPQQRVAAMRAGGTRLGGNAKVQRAEIGRVIDEMVEGLSKVDPSASASATGFANLAREQLASARTAQDRYRIGVSLVETLTDQTARAGDGEMGKVFGSYAERLWETMGKSELWLSPTELQKEGRRALKRQAKLIENVALGEEIAESIARGKRPLRPANDVDPRAPVDAEAVALGTGFAHVFSKSGRAAEAWKGSARQAASIDARIAAYGQRPEFLDELRERAASSRRTPWAKGHEKELWELQKDVLEENEALFPRVPYEVADEAAPAASEVHRVTTARRAGKAPARAAEEAPTTARSPGIDADKATTRDEFVATFLPRFRDQIEEEIDDEVADFMRDMGRVPKRGSPEWQVAEDQVVQRRVARAAKEGRRGMATGEAMGVAALLGTGLAAGNVLARARRKADEETTLGDLEGMPPDERAEAIRANGQRYETETLGRLTESLVDSGLAITSARDELMSKLGELTPEASDAQRQFAASAALGVAAGESALRAGGYTEDAKTLEDALDALIAAEVGHDQRGPVDHDAGDLLGHLVAAHDALRRHANELPADVAESLAALAEGTEREELWGDAGALLRDLRAADGAGLGADPADPDAVRAYLEAGQATADLLERWGADSEKLRIALGAVDEHDRSLATLRGEIAAAGVGNAGQSAGELSGVLESAASEAGVDLSADDLLRSLPSGMADMFRAGERVSAYDSTLRSIERGSGAAARRAARGAAGAVARRDEVDPDMTSAEFFAGYSDELAAFEARRDMIESVVTDPMQLADAMASSYGHLSETHPEVFSQLTDMAVRATEVLTMAMPASVQVSLAQPRGLPPSVDDVRAFARVYMAVTAPDTFLRDLESGQAWPEQSQAFAQMYPQQWSLMAEEAVAVARERATSLSPQEATYLDITFGIGNTIGGMWSDSGADAIRGAIQQAQEAKEQAKQRMQPAKPGAGMPTSATAALGSGPSSLPVS